MPAPNELYAQRPVTSSLNLHARKILTGWGSSLEVDSNNLIELVVVYFSPFIALMTEVHLFLEFEPVKP